MCIRESHLPTYIYILTVCRRCLYLRVSHVEYKRHSIPRSVVHATGAPRTLFSLLFLLLSLPVLLPARSSVERKMNARSTSLSREKPCQPRRASQRPQSPSPSQHLGTRDNPRRRGTRVSGRMRPLGIKKSLISSLQFSR